MGRRPPLDELPTLRRGANSRHGVRGMTPPEFCSGAPLGIYLFTMASVSPKLPLLRQLQGDALGLGRAARSKRSRELTPRTSSADRVVQSVCPYCAVGCGQKVYVKDEKVIQIEGDPDSPISRGRLCPKGAASEKLVNSPMRETRVKYRRPGGGDWEYISFEQAMDMIADRMIAAREQTWEEETDDGQPLKRTLGIHFLGGATLDSEENYLIKKFFTAMGALSIENQARI